MREYKIPIARFLLNLPYLGDVLLRQKWFKKLFFWNQRPDEAEISARIYRAKNVRWDWLGADHKYVSKAYQSESIHLDGDFCKLSPNEILVHLTHYVNASLRSVIDCIEAEPNPSDTSLHSMSVAWVNIRDWALNREGRVGHLRILVILKTPIEARVGVNEYPRG